MLIIIFLIIFACPKGERRLMSLAFLRSILWKRWVNLLICIKVSNMLLMIFHFVFVWMSSGRARKRWRVFSHIIFCVFPHGLKDFILSDVIQRKCNFITPLRYNELVTIWWMQPVVNTKIVLVNNSLLTNPFMTCLLTRWSSS